VEGCPDDEASYAVRCNAGDETTCTCVKDGVEGKRFTLEEPRLPRQFNDAVRDANTGCNWNIPPESP